MSYQPEGFMAYERAMGAVAHRVLRCLCLVAVYVGVGEWSGSHGAAMAAVCGVFLLVEAKSE